MVRHCCVPGCSSNINIPLHRFPKDVQRASTWLIAIERQNLIDLLSEKLAQLRICTEHFSEDMFLKDRARRCLKENAMPTLHIDLQNDVQEDPMLVPTIPEEINEVETSNIKLKVLKAEMRKCKKILHKKKLIIKKQRRKLRKKSTWNDVLKDVSGAQKTFFELISNHMKSAPRVSFPIVYF
ncbi:hypothetical protein PUN28_017782 [Cardiocondyla obscurior]|uniref:THAP-type domain-containing protein n=1 Tax=Cardiocondyla obscurior TaxID=286306 RepID=A0AAW2ELD5_9HYME